MYVGNLKGWGTWVDGKEGAPFFVGEELGSVSGIGKIYKFFMAGLRDKVGELVLKMANGMSSGSWVIVFYEVGDGWVEALGVIYWNVSLGTSGC